MKQLAQVTLIETILSLLPRAEYLPNPLLKDEHKHVIRSIDGNGDKRQRAIVPMDALVYRGRK